MSNRAHIDGRAQPRFLMLLAAIVLMSACADSGNQAPTTASSDDTTTSTTSADQLGEAYADEITDLLENTEQLIQDTEESAGNEDVYRTVASAYSGLGDLLEGVEPPSSLRVNHQALVAMARLIAEEAESVAAIPALSIGPDGLPRTGDRFGPGFSLAEHRSEFRSAVADLAKKARRAK